MNTEYAEYWILVTEYWLLNILKTEYWILFCWSVTQQSLLAAVNRSLLMRRLRSIPNAACRWAFGHEKPPSDRWPHSYGRNPNTDAVELSVTRSLLATVDFLLEDVSGAAQTQNAVKHSDTRSRLASVGLPSHERRLCHVMCFLFCVVVSCCLVWCAV